MNVHGTTANRVILVDRRMVLLLSVVLAASCSRGRRSEDLPKEPLTDVPWAQKVNGITWVAYSPSTGNPNAGIEPKLKEIEADLAILRSAQFTGLVTYGSGGILGKELPRLAESAGFKGLILGIWDPKSQEERAAAEKAAASPIVLGFCVGNEGFGDRYNLDELSRAIQTLRKASGKPVTTTEQIDDYYQQEELLVIGDWVFPNVHPYFHHRFAPKSAARWTKGQLDELKSKTDRFVLFKEVGLPTAGNEEARLSEASQEQYYLELAKTDVPFVYFEAFDLTWKDHLPIEPHWGLFRSDRTPKALASRLINEARAAGPE